MNSGNACIPIPSLPFRVQEHICSFTVIMGRPVRCATARSSCHVDDQTSADDPCSGNPILCYATAILWTHSCSGDRAMQQCRCLAWLAGLLGILSPSPSCRLQSISLSPPRRTHACSQSKVDHDCAPVLPRQCARSFR